MLSKLYTATLWGVDCKIIEVEVDFRKGNYNFSIVGLPDKTVQESKERVIAAIKSSGMEFVPMIIVANLAPAELIKTGSGYDLPLAIGYLIASEQLVLNTEAKLFIGELALDGRLRPINGALPIADAAKRLGYKEIYLPYENAEEAALTEGLDVFPVRTLSDLVLHFLGVQEISPIRDRKFEFSKRENYFDMSQVKGQEHSKRALEISAAGGHNILLSGVPGSGKTLLSKCMPSILPEITLAESLEVTRVYSISGLTSKEVPLIDYRPFRAPHHTSSHVALVGGGAVPHPGEISLAHRGILFLDEFPEFSSEAIEALRQPLEDGVVTISRASAAFTFPANFILVAAMNPCKCGFRGDLTKECSCTTSEIIRYQKKLSGPILDRIDLLVNVPKVEHKKLFDERLSENSEAIRLRVQKARELQLNRFKDKTIFSNSEINQKDIFNFINLDNSSKKLLDMAVRRLNLTARSYFRILRVSRTIADLEGNTNVEENHVTEALSYRVEISS